LVVLEGPAQFLEAVEEAAVTLAAAAEVPT
jgi:hypothetical protein